MIEFVKDLFIGVLQLSVEAMHASSNLKSTHRLFRERFQSNYRWGNQHLNHTIAFLSELWFLWLIGWDVRWIQSRKKRYMLSHLRKSWFRNRGIGGEYYIETYRKKDDECIASTGKMSLIFRHNNHRNHKNHSSDNKCDRRI